MPYDESIVARFWTKVRICVHGRECDLCCWEWQGARDPHGYGNFFITRAEGKAVYTHAHAVALELHQNSFLSLDLWGLHRCDNPPCCNYFHLFAGTRQDNIDDMRRKGREARGDRHGSKTHPERFRHQGEDNPEALLTAAKVLEMRTLAQTGLWTLSDLARRYGVAPGTVRSACLGETWAHLGAGIIPRWRRFIPVPPQGVVPPPPLKGEANPKAKLTDPAVGEIRTVYAAGLSTFQQLAQRYGVSWQLIQRIVKREVWRHVP